MILHANGLLIDLDGTLVDTKAAVEASWRDIARHLGLPFSRFAPYVHGLPADRVLQEAAPDLNESQRERWARAALRHQSDPGVPVRPLPGAADLLSAVPRNRWAIVTSGDRQLAAASIAKAGLPPPRVLVTADDVTAGKPDPEPYRRAASLLGIRPQDCVVLEDSPGGISSAAAAGAAVIAVATTHGAAQLLDALAVVNDLMSLSVADLGSQLEVKVKLASR